MIKKLLTITMLLGTLLLTGCHGNVDRKTFEVPEDFDDTKTYEITFWAKNDTNKTQTMIYEKAIADFEKAYPNIKVNLRLYSDYGSIYNDVITNISTGTTPNVCITYPDHIATYLTGENVVVPLDSLISNKKYGLGGSRVNFDSVTKGEMVEKYLEECKFGGYYYAVPYMRSSEACYVNKTLVEKLGYTLPETLTWDFIWEVSEAATRKNADGLYELNGQKVLIPFIYKSTDNMMIQLLRQAQAGYSEESGEILIFNDVTREYLKDISAHTKAGAFSTFKISGYPGNFFNAGQCIFGIDSTAGSTWMGSNAPLLDISADKLVQFETVVMTVPQVDPQNPQMISQGPSICIFNKDDPQEVLAAWLFTQYLLTNDVQIAYSETEGYVPVTKKAQQAPEYLDYLSREGEDNNQYYDVKIQATRLLMANEQNTFVTPVFNGSASLRDAAGQLIETTVKSTRRKAEVNDEFIDNLYDEVNSLYRLDQIAVDETGKKKLGLLPKESRMLIAGFIFTWVCIGLYLGKNLFKMHKNKNGK